MLASVEHAGYIDLHDAVKVVGRSLQRVNLLRDACASDGTPELRSLRLGSFCDGLCYFFDGGLIRDVAFVICGRQLVGVGNLCELRPFVGGGGLEDVEAGDVAASFDDGEGEGDAKASTAPGDEDRLALQREELVGGMIGGRRH